MPSQDSLQQAKENNTARVLKAIMNQLIITFSNKIQPRWILTTWKLSKTPNQEIHFLKTVCKAWASQDPSSKADKLSHRCPRKSAFQQERIPKSRQSGRSVSLPLLTLCRIATKIKVQTQSNQIKDSQKLWNNVYRIRKWWSQQAQILKHLRFGALRKTSSHFKQFKPNACL